MDYSTLIGSKGGFAFDVKNPPAPKTKLVLTDKQVVTFDEMGPAGMLVCTDRQNAQQLFFPFQVAAFAAVGA